MSCHTNNQKSNYSCKCDIGTFIKLRKVIYINQLNKELLYSVQHSSRDAQAGTFLSMLVKTAGLRVGFATILAPKVSLSGVDNHVLFQAGSTRETLAANITWQHVEAPRSLKQKNKIYF